MIDRFGSGVMGEVSNSFVLVSPADFMVFMEPLLRPKNKLVHKLPFSYYEIRDSLGRVRKALRDTHPYRHSILILVYLNLSINSYMARIYVIN